MIYVDRRAGSGPLVEMQPLLDLKLNGECELTTLDSADVMFVGNGPDGEIMVGVEVKSLPDLLSSSSTGRLQATQLPAMLTTYDHSYLLYYGEYRCSPDGHLQLQRGQRWVDSKLTGSRPAPYSYLAGLLTTIAQLGVRIYYSPNLNTVPWSIATLYRWYQKPWEKHKGMRTFDNSRSITFMPNEDPGVMLRARVAAQLPGIGFDRAIAVGRHFQSVVEMLSAPEAEWVKIKGIGKTLARSVVAVLRDR